MPTIYRTQGMFLESALRRAAWRSLALVSPLWERPHGATPTIRILAYHGVPDSDLFRSHCNYLSKNYSMVGMYDVSRYLVGDPVDDRACWVTFDDGDQTVVDVALPILGDFGIPATMFINPGVVDSFAPLWWQIVSEAAENLIEVTGRRVTNDLIQELKAMPDSDRRRIVSDVAKALELQLGRPPRRRQLNVQDLKAWTASGHTIGNHTWDHPLLNFCSKEDQVRQIEEAHTWILSQLGSPPVAFSYPNGNRTDFAKSLLVSLGYELAVGFDHRLSNLDDSFDLSRIRVNADDQTHELRARVSGAHPAVHRLLGRK